MKLRPQSDGYSDQSKKSFKTVFLAIAGLAVLGGSIYGLIVLDLFGSTPQFELRTTVNDQLVDEKNPVAVGKNLPLTVAVANGKNACQLEASVIQNQSDLAVLKRTNDSQDEIWKVDLSSQNISVQEGEAVLRIKVASCGLIKRTAEKDFKIALDLLPPQIQVTSSQHYINQGGAGVITYKVSPDTIMSGVKVGEQFFKGFKNPQSPADSGNYFTLFVFAYNQGVETPINVVAFDGAGNQAKLPIIPAKFFPKEFRHRDLEISDDFIQTKVMAILGNTSGVKISQDNLQNFLTANRELRKKNNQFLVDLSKKSDEKFYWNDAFKPLGNAAIEASFADYRSYMYNGQKVDEQVHLGFDMAVTKQYPIVASAAGKVAFVGYLGIYGNTVVIDHGFGLETLYAHLSSMDVKEGDMVTQGQKIANSGETGMAGGDHLHYSMLIQGVQTNPVEFWDQHWIDDNVYLRIDKQLFGQK